jgi:hypothetical protein
MEWPTRSSWALAVQDRERCLAQLDKGVIVNQALGKDVVVGRLCVHAANHEARMAAVRLPPS